MARAAGHITIRSMAVNLGRFSLRPLKTNRRYVALDSNCATPPDWLAHSFGRRPHCGSRRAGGGRATGTSTTTDLTQTAQHRDLARRLGLRGRSAEQPHPGVQDERLDPETSTLADSSASCTRGWARLCRVRARRRPSCADAGDWQNGAKPPVRCRLATRNLLNGISLARY